MGVRKSVFGFCVLRGGGFLSLRICVFFPILMESLVIRGRVFQSAFAVGEIYIYGILDGAPEICFLCRLCLAWLWVFV